MGKICRQYKGSQRLQDEVEGLLMLKRIRLGIQLNLGKRRVRPLCFYQQIQSNTLGQYELTRKNSSLYHFIQHVMEIRTKSSTHNQQSRYNITWFHTNRDQCTFMYSNKNMVPPIQVDVQSQAVTRSMLLRKKLQSLQSNSLSPSPSQ